MKKLLISLFLIISLSVLINVQAEGNTLVVHYYRYDDNYEDWNLWLWPNKPTPGSAEGPHDGGAYQFNGTDEFGKVLTLDLSTTNMEGATELGLIVRQDDWAQKDVAMDRFFDLTFDESGEMHIYLVQATEEIFYSRDEVDTTKKIFSARFMDDNTVEFVTTSAVDEGDISILEDGLPFEIAQIYSGGTKRRFDVLNPLDLSKQYTLVIDFGTYTKEARVDMSGLYNTDLFNEQFVFDGELGAIYSEESTTFRLWAPVSEEATLNLYNYGHPSTIEDYDGVVGDDTPFETYDLVKTVNGVLEVTVDGDLHGTYLLSHYMMSLPTTCR